MNRERKIVTMLYIYIYIYIYKDCECPKNGCSKRYNVKYITWSLTEKRTNSINFSLKSI